MRNRKTVKILKHHRTSDVYIDGRYLVVASKISMRSKRGLEIARETALTILQAIEESEDSPPNNVEEPSNGGSSES